MQTLDIKIHTYTHTIYIFIYIFVQISLLLILIYKHRLLIFLGSFRMFYEIFFSCVELFVWYKISSPYFRQFSTFTSFNISTKCDHYLSQWNWKIWPCWHILVTSFSCKYTDLLLRYCTNRLWLFARDISSSQIKRLRLKSMWWKFCSLFFTGYVNLKNTEWTLRKPRSLHIISWQLCSARLFSSCDAKWSIQFQSGTAE